MKITLSTDQGEVLGIYPIIVGDSERDDVVIVEEHPTQCYWHNLESDIRIHLKNGVK